MSKKIKEPPPPGSDKAIKMGCACPVLDNCYGRGYQGVAGFYVYTLNCPVHEPSITPKEKPKKRISP